MTTCLLVQMYETVCDLYQEAFGESMDGVISVEQVLLAYIAHAMHKMNCIHGFVAHMPGGQYHGHAEPSANDVIFCGLVFQACLDSQSPSTPNSAISRC